MPKTRARITTRKVSTEQEGYLDVNDLYPLIQKLVPEAPSDATINVWVDVPGGGDWSDMKIDIDLVNHIKFTVSWEHSD
jgi:hypothetical protein